MVLHSVPPLMYSQPMNNINTGFFSRLPAEEYHSLPGISISRLKELKRSAQHYKYRLEHPKATKALTLGTATHCAILEPERFGNEFAVWDRRTDAGKMAPRSGQHWEAFKAANAGRTLITEEERDLALTMQAAVRGHQDAMVFLEAGEPELTMRWALTDVACRGRIDWLARPNGKPVLVGLKTTRDCRPFVFGSQAAKLSYHLQWAFYHDGYKALTGDEPEMIEIVVESDAPHAVAVYRIPSDIIEQGREEYEDLLVKLDEYTAAGFWPGPCEGIQDLTLPSWLYSKEADDISSLELE